MDCFRSAVRESFFRSTPSNGAPESDYAFGGLFKRAFSNSSSSSCADDDDQTRQTPCNLKRQRITAFLMSCYLCRIKSDARDEEGYEKEHSGLKKEHAHSKDGQYGQKGGMQWSQVSSKKRRKLGSRKWAIGEGSGNLLSRAPARFNRLLRRVRARMRNLGQFQKAASFHYDPLSYSMNFDDGCWQHCEPHAKLFSAPSPCNSIMVKKGGRGLSSSNVKAGGLRPCIWQRRQVRQPKMLRVTKATGFYS